MQDYLGPENAIWDDGEWVSWTEINQQIAYKEWGAKYPNADRSLVPIFEDLLGTAEHYFHLTGQHLPLYGVIGELFAAITIGLKLNKLCAPGADGRLGNDHIEVKTITPFKKHDFVELNTKGNFNKVFVVKVSPDFELAWRMIERKRLPKAKNGKIRLEWSDLPETRSS
ncbi:hypothetical protein K3152_00270 [Qipengyuania sp. 1NDH17]|uniref:VRR-NUC domain-containing protein n=1 Tax=Qipengyuania polymorpha TaxID=2867234 RepID=A0ABS7IX85_9SPHN|nr:hypothetical protein [Qipengyuania polymorpha]MBX7456670.1 hypothetical protein [Qipengyuania polymorpha]